ncbi:MAG: RNA-binding transcriptional accessory protein [Candidatus Hydrogenedentes bacterium]|nr:RNA-binding transcriptional accessory protein [Candidatus Hydrogenedentota bacterium]
MLEERFLQLISNHTRVPLGRVVKTIELYESGATIPFVARYRKDVTGNLNEEQLEAISEQYANFVELAARRTYVLDTIEKQGQLTDGLKKSILDCTDLTLLEDLYLPYKKAKRTKATVSREKGLAPLADFIWTQTPGDQTLDAFAQTFVRAEKAVASVEEAMDGAKHILAERVSVDMEARALVRDRMQRHGNIASHPTKNAEGKHTKFESYYNFSESVAKIPSHRYLAIHRGVKEGFLRMELAMDDASVIADLNTKFLKSDDGEFAPHIKAVIDDSYHRLLRPSIENEVLRQVQERADAEAIRVFRDNAHNLLLSPPAGAMTVIGVDPGLKTGCKLAVIDSNGTFIDNATIYPTPPQNDVETAEKVLLALIEKHNAKAVAIGNGTGSREVARFIRQTLAKVSADGVFMVLVNEAGASIYSASKIARDEFPNLDVTVRGAISIARRMQDPLAELVKIEPRHIGVGQYQHDVNQKALREGLQKTVVSCVNAVGVDLNTASAPLLKYVSGIQSDTATNIVAFRTEKGGFKNRQQLLEVQGVGPKVFEQCAGFLRVRGGDQPLDATGIHPEAYPVVEQLAGKLGVDVPSLLEKPARVDEIDLHAFESEKFGSFTLHDIRQELHKPGRDPRKEFKVPKFLEGVDTVQALEENMEIEGVVTNVTDFGAFVDIGVHQDGLVHLSELANRFVQDPRDVVRVGDVVKVKVIKVDKALPRISLSIKALLPPPEPRQRPERHERRPHAPGPQDQAAAAPQPQQHARPQHGRPDQHRARGDERRDERPREQDRRPRHDEQRRRDDDRPARRPSRRDKEAAAELKSAIRGKGDRAVKHADNGGGPLNTQLADQLAALRNKLGA